MKKTLITLFLFIPSLTSAQKIKTLSGIIVNDITFNLIEYKKIDSVIAMNPGWRVPTINELQEIFNSTYDKAHLRCAVKPDTYFSSDYEIEGDGDTLRLTGMMYGKEFKAILPRFYYADRGHNAHALLLIKHL